MKSLKFWPLGISGRFLAILTTSVILTVAATTASNLWLSDRLMSQAADHELKQLQEFMLGRVRADAEQALAMADTIAENSAVQAAFGAKDRQALRSVMGESFKNLRDSHNVTLVHFHTTSAISFLRLHEPEKYGDDLSPTRPTIVDVNRTGRPVLGLEIGGAGVGIRGVTPVVHDGKAVGSVEVGLSFGKPLLESFKNNTGADLAIILKKSAGFDTYASTFTEFPHFEGEQVNAALGGHSSVVSRVLEGRTHAVALTPVKDYRGNIIGASILAIDQSRFTAAMTEARNWSIGVGLVVLSMTLCVATLLSRGIVRSLRALTAGMRRLADGDFEVVLPGLSRRDEIGEVAVAVEQFKVKAVEKAKTDAATQEREAARIREEQRLKVEDAIEAFRSSIEDMLGAVTKSAAAMRRNAQSINDVAVQASGEAAAATATSEQAAGSVQTVAAATEELSASIHEISRQVVQATDTVRNAGVKTGQSVTEIEALAGMSDRIGAVVNLIQAIAGQTNLLALNATIEAARAGEAGKGFAVVAQEVKLLAAQTAKATAEITGEVTAIQTSIKSAVEAVREIGIAMRDIGEATTSIATAVEQQSAATKEIAQNVQSAAQGNVTLVGNIASVNEAVAQARQSAGGVSAASGDLDAQAQRLSGEVAEFFHSLRTGALDRRKGQDPDYKGPERRKDRLAGRAA